MRTNRKYLKSKHDPYSTEMLDPMITPPAALSFYPLFTLPPELTALSNSTASEYAEANRFFLLTHVFPSSTYAMGSNPTGSATIDNWNMNDFSKCMRHGWWESDKLKWTHSDFKNVALLYTQEVYKEMVRRGDPK